VTEGKFVEPTKLVETNLKAADLEQAAPAVELNSDWPLVTFLVFSYNQEKTIEAACRAALAQTYPNLELLFSDDCSSDSTYEIIQTICKPYGVKHKIVMNRNDTNLGLIEHVNKGFKMARGELIIAAAGDDISDPSRTTKIVDAYLAHSRRPLLIHSSVIMVDNHGNDIGLWRPPIITQNYNKEELATAIGIYIGATGAWSKKLHEQFGEIRFLDAYEDSVLGFRAIIEDKILFLDEPLVRYRATGGVVGGPVKRSGETRETIETRMKTYRLELAIYCQRLSDLDRVGTPKNSEIRATLERKVIGIRKRIMFFQNPAALFFSIFSREIFVSLKAIASGFRLMFVTSNFVSAFFKDKLV
jgi:glycosyltransferase involved in cell wall biosynthesis